MDESPGKMYALAIVLTSLATAAVGLRFYARKLRKICPSWDDYLILFALVFTFGTAICMVVGAAIGALGRHTHLSPDGFPVFDHRMEVMFEITYFSQLTQTLTFGLTKLAVVLFYRRIFATRTFSIISWIMIGVIVIWTIAFFAANLLQCLPISETWTNIVAGP
ncbi:hypothetical protein MMC28_003719, partial [Mycoblastus sanguinarius]|nr:hypothetical protein [Mycoblastus sanguinarius]